MRRFILIFLMFLIPFQWTWAAAANVCQHEVGGAHFGHYEHEHDSANPGELVTGEENDAKSLSVHPDCQVCHGIGAGYVPASTGSNQVWPRDRLVPGECQDFCV